MVHRRAFNSYVIGRHFGVMGSSKPGEIGRTGNKASQRRKKSTLSSHLALMSAQLGTVSC